MVWGSNICNWRIDFQNRYGSTIYSTSSGTLNSNCQMTGVSRTRATNWTAKVGVECARLFVNGTFRGEQCHSITA
jgi:hypothetical protein